MTRFSWDRILNATNGDVVAIVDILPTIKTTDKYKGKSFIVNLDGLIRAKASSFDKANYLGLCALRNYADVWLYNDLTLDRRFTQLTDAQITQNKLLKLLDGKIILTLEQ